MDEVFETSYGGLELDLFALAENWKRYIKDRISMYIRGDVLEVGAGIGATTAALNDGAVRRWVCLEPDPVLARRMNLRLQKSMAAKTAKVIVGSIRALVEKPSFDCILYIDVLEHIEDDRAEIQAAARLVRPGGHIVVLSPAHRWLLSEFDRCIGHRRRYNRAGLRALMPDGWFEESSLYMDSVGVLLSLGNAIGLRQSMPSPSQLRFWDRVCLPVSRRLDPFFCGTIGKSVLAVWRKAGAA